MDLGEGFAAHRGSESESHSRSRPVFGGRQFAHLHGGRPRFHQMDLGVDKAKPEIVDGRDIPAGCIVWTALVIGRRLKPDAVEAGPAFTGNLIGTIDDSAGLVDDVDGATSRTDVGDDKHALLPGAKSALVLRGQPQSATIPMLLAVLGPV